MTTPENQVPLIWTIKGNIPIQSLKHEVSWTLSEENIIFTESYSLDGEIVKQSSHVCILKGAEAIGEAQELQV